jgi:integrase
MSTDSVQSTVANISPLFDVGRGMPRHRSQSGSLHLIGDPPRWEARWAVYITGPDGQEQRKSKEKILAFESVMDRHEAEKELASLIEEAAGPACKNPGMTLSSFIRLVYIPNRQKYWRPKWKGCLLSIFKCHFYEKEIGQKPLNDISRADCQRFIESVAAEKIETKKGIENMSRSIVKKCRWQLKRILDEAVAEDLIGKNRAELLDIPRDARQAKETSSLTFEQMALALAVTYRKKDKEDYLIAMCSLGVGLRPNETFATRANDVTPGQLMIDEGIVENILGDVKTNCSEAPVAISAEFEAELREYIAKKGLKPTDFLFTYATGNPISQNNYVQRQLKTLGKKIGVPDLNFRMMRTSYATHVATHSDNPKDLQTALRHEDPLFSMKVYRKPIPESTRKMQHGFHTALRAEQGRQEATLTA